MPENSFDQAGRYALKLNPPGFLAWSLHRLETYLVFTRWLDTQTIPFPGDPDRRCDTVAELVAPSGLEPPWAMVLESQTQPDYDMPDRLLEYLARLRIELRHGPRGRGRYQVGAAVVYLTGTGQPAKIEMALPGNLGVELRFCFAVVMMAEQDAAATLLAIREGRVDLCLLPWIPLMRGGNLPETIVEWKELAQRETDARRMADYGGLAVIFAELTDCKELWQKALEGWAMRESTVVKEWQAEGRAEGRDQGRIETLRDVLLGMLKRRLPDGIPSDIAEAVQSETTLAKLSRWTELIDSASSLDQFALILA